MVCGNYSCQTKFIFVERKGRKKRIPVVSVYEKQIGGSHYLKMKIQPSEFANKNNLPFAEGNAIKYICRHKYKGGKEDLKKAKHYIEMIEERDYGNE